MSDFDDVLNKKKISPDGRYYAFLNEHNGFQNIWKGDSSENKPPYPITDQTKEDIRQFDWSRTSNSVVFTMKDENGILSLYNANIHDGRVSRLARKHDYDQLVASMIPIVSSIYDSKKEQNKILELVLSYPKTFHVSPKVDTEVSFELYNELSSEKKEAYLHSMCWSYLDSKLNPFVLEPQKWQRNAAYYDSQESERYKRRVAGLRELNVRTIWLGDVPKEIIPRGTRAVSLIQETILKEFPDRILQTKKKREIRVLHRYAEVYFFPRKEQENDILWVSYDQYHCEIGVGFGRADMELFLEYNFPWASRYPKYEVVSMNELENVVNSLCAAMKYVYPYFQRFIDAYNKLRSEQNE